MIRNIVFDMGKVLIDFDPAVFVRRLKLAEEDARFLMPQVFRSVEWANMDWGIMTDEEAVASICGRVPERLHDAVRRLVLEWDRPIMPIDGMEELIGGLKGAGYGIYLLSNASRRHPDYWPRIPASRFFDGVLVSYSVKTVKPQPEIYKMLCDRFGLKAEECFFVDDLPLNVAGACRSGMSGMVFHGDTEELRQALKATGVAPACAGA